MDLKSRLKKFEKTFKTAKKRAQEQGAFGSELPDSKYKAQLASCALGFAQSSGRLQVSFEYKVLAGEYKGEIVRKYQSVETEDDQVWLARDFKRFGIEAPESSEDLQDIVNLLDEAKPELTISLRTKTSGQFCYVDKVHTEIDAGDFKVDENNDDAESTKDANENADSDEAPLEEGAEVEFQTKSGKMLKGTIAELFESEEEAEIEVENGNSFVIGFDSIFPLESAAEKGKEAEDGEEVSIEVGMKVEFESDDGTVTGKVVKILEDDEAVKVKDEDGQIHVIDANDLSLPGEVLEPAEKKSAKKERPKVIKKRIAKTRSLKKTVHKVKKRKR